MWLENEPVSPRGWLFLQRELPQVIHFTISFLDPIELPVLKDFLSSCFVKSCPRLRSLVVTDGNGHSKWVELPSIDIEKHIVVMSEDAEDNVEVEDDNDEAYVDRVINSLILTSNLRTDIPLWDVHVLPPKHQCLVLRLHHALGDALSVISPFFAGFDPLEPPSDIRSNTREEKKSAVGKISLTGTARWASGYMKAAWYTMPYAKEASLHAFGLKEDKTIIRGETSAVGMPRKLTTLTLSLEDMKNVKKKINGTVNDVFVGLIACGIAKYSKLVSNGPVNSGNMTVLNVVSRRKEGLLDMVEKLKQGREIEWGNNIGHFIIGINVRDEETDPLNYVRRSKEVLDKRKMSLEASTSYYTSTVAKSILGSWGYLRLATNLLSGISILLSNVNGFPHPITLRKNQVTKVGFTANGLPVPIDIRMMSYNGKAFLKVLTATKLIEDPNLLCKCIQDSLEEMKNR